MAASDPYEQTKSLEFLAKSIDSIPGIASRVSELKVATQDINANWLGFAGREENSTDLENAGAKFGMKTGEAWSTVKPDLEAILDILAGGMGTTRDLLLESMKNS